MTTLLLAEHDNKSLKDSTNKALTAAIALGGDVHILVAGKDAKPRLELVKTVEPPSRKSGVKVASAAELVAKLKDAGVIG